MRILVTAIGSMSAECTIKRLKEDGYYVVGCDIYPKEWHLESKLCDMFYQAPSTRCEEEYISFLLKTCSGNQLDALLPLTDLEIDVINRHRDCFVREKIQLCMQSSQVLSVVRDKYELYSFFRNDELVPTIETHLATEIPDSFRYPCVAKPCNGRSSEGLLKNASKEQVMAIIDKRNYVVQEQLYGNLFTVDYVRSSVSGCDAYVPRQELLRTSNGAGLTIKTCNDPKLISLVRHIGKGLNINGCVNMEFIFCRNSFYLIDINPRFSAGIAFSEKSGYDMVTNHMRCFTGDEIDSCIDIEERIIIKKYEEVFS